jgi:REP element-mobilizing transposase RayT
VTLLRVVECDDPAMRNRTPLRLRGYDYASLGAYLITVCAGDRASLFGTARHEIALSPIGRLVESSWWSIPVKHPGIDVDSAFVVMPNHVHGIVWVRRRPTSPIPAVVGAFKGRASRLAGQPLWQRGYHDRIIRDETELDALRQYIVDNPIRWAVDRENLDRGQRARAGQVRPLHRGTRSR